MRQIRDSSVLSSLIWIFSFFASPSALLQTLSASTSSAAAAETIGSGMTLDVCPNDYGGFNADSLRLTCGCMPEVLKSGGVRGANPYFWQSSICRAALHAGVIGAQGGQVVVTPEKATVFPAVTRNGVDSGSWGAGFGFRVAAAGAAPVVAAPPPPGGGMTLDVCPNDYGGFNADSLRLTCGCMPEALKSGGVRGANPYFWQSSICRAALHAGVIGAQGGQVVVTPEKATVFPAVTRNGVDSGSWDAGFGFRVAAVPGTLPPTRPASPVSAAVDAAGRPIQAPIAETLRTQRKVQVYINFVTDKADIQPSAEPVLRELLATLKGDQTLRVDLIGHTDSIGSSQHNQDLSERRAAAVYFWLVRHGIDPDRMRSSGRGFTEPIADNATAEGRALNRRVEVKAINKLP